MVCGIGIDIIEISRINRLLERFGMRFVQKILDAQEIAELTKHGQQIKAQSLAARFAAKEAAVKALGTGFSGGIGMHHIAIFKKNTGQPQLHFFGPAWEVFQRLGAQKSHISLSHTTDMATAMVILETK